MLWRDAEVGSLHSAVERPPCAMQKALVRVRNWEETLHSSGHKKQSVICGKSCLLKTRVQTIFQEKGKKKEQNPNPTCDTGDCQYITKKMLTLSNWTAKGRCNHGFFLFASLSKRTCISYTHATLQERPSSLPE